MIVRKLTLSVTVCICTLAGLVTFAGGSAQALVTHRYVAGSLPQLAGGVPVEGPHGEKVPEPGPLSLAGSSMTIDSGQLWIAEVGGVSKEGSPTYRIDDFDATTGAFISQLTHDESAPSYGEAGIAVGHSGGETKVYVGENLNTAGSAPVVAVFTQPGAGEKTWTGTGTPAGSFGEHPLGDVAIDNAANNPLDEHKGDVYVAAPQQGVIDIFHPEADGEEHYAGQITAEDIAGFPTGATFQPGKLAVSEANGDVVVLNRGVYDILEAGALGQYTLIGEISATPTGSLTTFNLAIDGVSGEIYVTDGFTSTVIDEFSPTGAYLGRITGEETPAGSIADVYSLTVDSQAPHDIYVGDIGGGHTPTVDVFGPDVVIPDVTSHPASGVSYTTATLNGTVNPDDGGQATCHFEWGTSRFLGEVAPCEPEAVAESATPVPAHAMLGQLLPDTTYFYRLQARNQNGTNPGEPSQDQEFTTPGPGIRHESVSDLAATSVTFHATVDPHGSPASYYFQYGTSAAYGADVPASPGETLGAGETDVDVQPFHVQGLQGGTVYHYRVVVVSEVKSGESMSFDGPDMTFTTQTATVSTLPDERRWEMVTPPDKDGSGIYAIGETAVFQAAGEGGAIAYEASSPTEAKPQSNAGEVQVLSIRGHEGWQTSDLGAPHEHPTGTGLNTGPEYRLFSEDLSAGVLQPFGSFVPSLSTEASEQTPYLRTLTASCGSSCYRPLVTGKPGYADVSPGTHFGEESEGLCLSLFCGPTFAGATPDLSHIVLNSAVALVPGASTTPGDDGLYEWSAGNLALVSVLPDGEKAGGVLGLLGRSARHAISNDGSRVSWELTNSALFMRDIPQERTIELDAPEPACLAAGACSNRGGGRFQIASADGSKVFFTDANRLTQDAGRAGSDLYECEIVEGASGIECRLSDLTPAHDGENAAVDGGVLGASEDGSYVYFVADGALAEKAIRGNCAEGFAAGRKCNLYVRHDGATKLITTLGGADQHDWYESLGGMPVRVSPNGQWVEFMSQEPLTGYDNRDAVSAEPDAEVYLYDANTGHLVCASCNPTGARPSGAPATQLTTVDGSIVWSDGWMAANVPGWINYTGGAALHQPRYLSDSGRLFFDSHDALAPQDVDGTEDVYEYEPAGVGACTAADATFSERSGGCIGLITAGTSAEESAFIDASVSGGDVFFLTGSRLALQDYDESGDIYDAHECTSIVPCYPAEIAQPPACTTAEACRAASAPQPAIFGAPSSSTFSGAGNVTAATPGGSTVKKKTLSRSQQLAKALKECRKHEQRHKRARATCDRRARTRYGKTGYGKAGSRSRKTASKKKGKR